MLCSVCTMKNIDAQSVYSCITYAIQCMHNTSTMMHCTLFAQCIHIALHNMHGQCTMYVVWFKISFVSIFICCVLIYCHELPQPRTKERQCKIKIETKPHLNHNMSNMFAKGMFPQWCNVQHAWAMFAQCVQCLHNAWRTGMQHNPSTTYATKESKSKSSSLILRNKEDPLPPPRESAKKRLLNIQFVK